MVHPTKKKKKPRRAIRKQTSAESISGAASGSESIYSISEKSPLATKDSHVSKKLQKVAQSEVDIDALLKHFAEDVHHVENEKCSGVPSTRLARKKQKKVDTQKHKTKSQHSVPTIQISPENAETQLDELVAIDAIYSHSVRITKPGHLIPTDSLLKNVRFVDESEEDDEEFESGMKSLLKGTTLMFNQHQGVEEGSIEYKITLSSGIQCCAPLSSEEELSQRQSSRRSSAMGSFGSQVSRRHRRLFNAKKSLKRLITHQASVADITVNYPVRYPEASPLIIIHFSFTLSIESEHQLTTTITDVLNDCSGVERILPVCVAISDVLSEREALVREKDSALWEQMQQRDKKLQATCKTTPVDKRVSEKERWSTGSGIVNASDYDIECGDEMGYSSEESSLDFSRMSDDYTSGSVVLSKRIKKKVNANTEFSDEDRVRRLKAGFSTMSDICSNHGFEASTVVSLSSFDHDDRELWKTRQSDDMTITSSDHYEGRSPQYDWLGVTRLQSIDSGTLSEDYRARKTNRQRRRQQFKQNNIEHERSLDRTLGLNSSSLFQGSLETWGVVDIQVPIRYADHDIEGESPSPRLHVAKPSRSRRGPKSSGCSPGFPPLESDHFNNSCNASPTTPCSCAESDNGKKFNRSTASLHIAPEVRELTLSVGKVHSRRKTHSRALDEINEITRSIPRRRSLNVIQRSRISTEEATSSNELRKEEPITDTKPTLSKDTSAVSNRFRLTRYVKDFEELSLQPPSRHPGQVVSKVRHKIDLNIYAIKRIQWPRCPLVLPNLDRTATLIEGKSYESNLPKSVENLINIEVANLKSPLPELARTSSSSPPDFSDISTVNARMLHGISSVASFGTLENSVNTAFAAYRSIDQSAGAGGLLKAIAFEMTNFVKAEFLLFSTNLYRRLMVEISKLSRLQHICIGRVLQGWIQKANPSGSEARALRQPIFFATLRPQCLLFPGSAGELASLSAPTLAASVTPTSLPRSPLAEEFSSAVFPPPPMLVTSTTSPLRKTPSITRKRRASRLQAPSLDCLEFPLRLVSTPYLENVVGDRLFCLQMEFCHGATLRAWIDRGRLGPRELRRVWALFRQLLEVLVVMHREGVQHRGLSPSNIFVDVDDQGAQSVKVGDFGLGNLISREALSFYRRIQKEVIQQRAIAKQSLNSQSHSYLTAQLMFNSQETQQNEESEQADFSIEQCLVRWKNALEGLKKELLTEAEGYLPEEFFEQSLSERNSESINDERASFERLKTKIDPETSVLPPAVIDEKADIYSLGLVLFEMSHEPFRSPSQRFEALRYLTSKHPPPQELLGGIPSQAASLIITQMLNPNPAKRPTAAQLLYREALVPPAVGKATLKQFLLRLSSPTTNESVRTMSILYSRLLDLRTAESFYSYSRHWDSLLQHISSSAYKISSKALLPFVGNSFSLFSGCNTPKRWSLQALQQVLHASAELIKDAAQKSKRTTGSEVTPMQLNLGAEETKSRTDWENLREILFRIAPGLFSSHFDWRSGPNAKAYQLAVVRDAVWQLVERTFLSCDATMVDLPPLRYDVGQCDCGAVITNELGGFQFSTGNEFLRQPKSISTAASRPRYLHYVMSDLVRPCWRSVLEKCQHERLVPEVCDDSKSSLASPKSTPLPFPVDSQGLQNSFVMGSATDGGLTNRICGIQESEGLENFINAEEHISEFTFLPSMLLDQSGALTCLIPDLLTSLALTSAIYLLSQRPYVLKVSGKFNGNVPTCFRQYCIRSVHHNGPHFNTNYNDTTSIDYKNTGVEPIGSIHPKSSLRAIFDVIVWLDLAFRDTSYDRSNIQLNVMMLEAEHITSCVDAIAPLSPLLGPIHVVWTHSDFLSLLFMDVCKISDPERLQILDAIIRLFGCPIDLPVLVYILFLAPTNDLEATVAYGSLDSLVLSDSQWTSLVSHLDTCADLEFIFKVWTMQAMVLQELILASSGRVGRNISIIKSVVKKTTSESPPKKKFKKRITQPKTNEMIPLTFDQLDALIYFGLNYITASIGTLELPKTKAKQSLPSRNQIWKPGMKRPQLIASSLHQKTRIVNPPARHIDELLRHLNLVEKAFSLSSKSGDAQYIFDIGMNFDTCAFNSTDSIAFRLVLNREYIVASGGRYDRLINSRLQYLLNTNPILHNTSPDDNVINQPIIITRDATKGRHVISTTQNAPNFTTTGCPGGRRPSAGVDYHRGIALAKPAVLDKEIQNTGRSIDYRTTFARNQVKNFDKTTVKPSLFKKPQKEKFWGQTTSSHGVAAIVAEFDLERIAELLLFVELRRSSTLKITGVAPSMKQVSTIRHERQGTCISTQQDFGLSTPSNLRAESVATVPSDMEHKKKRRTSAQESFASSVVPTTAQCMVEQLSLGRSPFSSFLTYQTPVIVVVTQKRRHQVAAFSLVESVVTSLQLSCNLRICAVFDLTKLRERLRASGVFCLVVLVPGVRNRTADWRVSYAFQPFSGWKNASHSTTTHIISELPNSVTALSDVSPFDHREPVSYRVEFLNITDLGSQLTHLTGGSHQHQTKSYIRLDSDSEVIQLIRNTFQRLSR